MFVIDFNSLLIFIRLRTHRSQPKDKSFCFNVTNVLLCHILRDDKMMSLLVSKQFLCLECSNVDV